MIGQSITQTVRMAEAVIQRHRQSNSAPLVIWARLDETPEGFALRCAALHTSGSRVILAAVPYGFAVPIGVRAVEFPEKHFRLLHPEIYSRYRIGSGGRGSAKSHSFATAIVLRMLMKRIRVLCAREIQRSLRESVHKLLTGKIDKLGLGAYFEINDREITCRVPDSEVIFAGLMTNVQQLKSLEGVDLCWIEEGESVSQRSFEILPPTIRNSGSEIWISLNPDATDAPVMAYIDSGRNDVRHEHATFEDKPWFPVELEGERAQCQRTDPDLYAHTWLGMTRTFSDAQVFKDKYEIREFEPAAGWNGSYFGADWGSRWIQLR